VESGGDGRREARRVRLEGRGEYRGPWRYFADITETTLKLCYFVWKATISWHSLSAFEEIEASITISCCSIILVGKVTNRSRILQLVYKHLILDKIGTVFIVIVFSQKTIRVEQPRKKHRTTEDLILDHCTVSNHSRGTQV
jgi:hypothetical protein